MSISIRHDTREQRFVADIEGSSGFLAYRKVGAGTFELRSTFVPVPLRGRGIGERLVRHALDHARAEGWKVVPLCGFVATFVERHPEYADLIAPAG